MTPPSIFPYNIIQEIQEFFSDEPQAPCTPGQAQPGQAPVTPPPFQPPDPSVLDRVQDFFQGVVREIPRAYRPITVPLRQVPALWGRGVGIMLREGSTFLPEHMPPASNVLDWAGIALGLPLIGVSPFASPLAIAGIQLAWEQYFSEGAGQRLGVYPAAQNSNRDNQNTSPTSQAIVFHRVPGECRMPAQEEILECR